ncbi:hypothetical protein NFI96_012295 [Prochilodus magdalenae]|nr:hypothetical protein NFI96_012295 [Prochilodus magdalenae]
MIDHVDFHVKIDDGSFVRPLAGLLFSSSVQSRRSSVIQLKLRSGLRDSSMAQEFVKAKIRGDKVVVFQKPSCPYCGMAKNVLSKYKFKEGCLEFIDISGRDDMGSIQDYLQQITGARTESPEYLELPGDCNRASVGDKVSPEYLELPEEQESGVYLEQDVRLTGSVWFSVEEQESGVYLEQDVQVPRVFIGEECIGGGSDVAELDRSGKLTGMLQNIGAL